MPKGLGNVTFLEGDLAVITVPEVLREKLGPEAAQALVELLDYTTRETRDQVVLLAEERFGRRLAQTESHFERRLSAFERRVLEEIGSVRRDIAAIEPRLLRWSFVFWTTQMLLLLGVLFAFFRS